MNQERALKVVLVLVGLFFLAGVYPVADSLWHANANQSDLRRTSSRVPAEAHSSQCGS